MCCSLETPTSSARSCSWGQISAFYTFDRWFLPSLNTAGPKRCPSLPAEGKVGESPAARSSDCWESPKRSPSELHPHPDTVLGCSNRGDSSQAASTPKTGAGDLNSHCPDSHHSPKSLDKAKPAQGTLPSCSCLQQSPRLGRRADSSTEHLESHQENEGLQEGLHCSKCSPPKISREKDP